VGSTGSARTSRSWGKTGGPQEKKKKRHVDSLEQSEQVIESQVRWGGGKKRRGGKGEKAKEKKPGTK